MLDERLQDALNEKYCGKKVKEECVDSDCLEEEGLLEEKAYIDDGNLEIRENMNIQVELDDDDCIDFVSVDFHTSCWGDSGLGEEDPEDFWSYEMCLSAAEQFIEGILE